MPPVRTILCAVALALAVIASPSAGFAKQPPASSGLSLLVTAAGATAASEVAPAPTDAKEPAVSLSQSQSETQSQQPPKMNLVMGILIALGPILAALLLVFRKKLNRGGKVKEP